MKPPAGRGFSPTASYMAEGPLPDVVPTVDFPVHIVTEVKCAVYSSMSLIGAEQQLGRPDDLGTRVLPPPVVQIWTSVSSPMDAEFRRDSVNSELGFVDSGIESQQLSPCLGLEDHGGEFSSSQNGTMLSIPQGMTLRRKPHNKESSLEFGIEVGENTDNLRASPVKLHKAAELLRRDSSSDSLEKQQQLVPGLPGFLPRTRAHRNFVTIDYGIQGWRLQEEGFQKMMHHEHISISSRSSSDRPSTMEDEEEANAPPILIVESETNDLCGDGNKDHVENEVPMYRASRNHRSLEDSRPSIAVNRLSLDERNSRTIFSSSLSSNSRVPLSTEESLEGERNSTGSAGTTRLHLSSSDRGISDEDNRSESYQPSRTQSISNSTISEPPETTGFSRQPSFGSVRSECVDMQSRRESSEFAVARNWNSKSGSRHFFLSVPPRLSICNWPSTRSQPGSRRHSAQSQCSMGKTLNPNHSPFVSRLSISRPSSPSPYHRLGSDDELDIVALLESGVLPFIPSATTGGGGLSLTQRLAFPELVATEQNKSRNRELYIEPEGNLNFFAKIITLLVLVFVVVLVVGVFVKLFHPPQ